MGTWLVRAGLRGESEEGALDNNVITMHWNEFPDLGRFQSKDGLVNYYFQSHPDAKKTQAASEVNEIWDFVNTIQKGDLVIVPLKTQAMIVAGEVQGPYEYRQISSEIKHIRPVRWIKKIPRIILPKNMLYLLAMSSAVFQIKDGKLDELIKDIVSREAMITVSDPSDQNSFDIEQYAEDLVARYVVNKFSDNSFVRLVESVLQSQGYMTKRISALSGLGAHLLASSANIGFDYPRILIYINSQISALDVKDLKDLRALMVKNKADQAVAISCGGFTQKALQDARDTISLKLWDLLDLSDNIYRNYERLPGDIKAELPLKKIWAMVE